MKKLVLLVLFLCPLRAFAHINLIDKVAAVAADADTINWASTDMTGANALTISIVFHSPSADPTCTDSEMNSYTKIVEVSEAFSLSTAIYVSLGLAPGDVSNMMTFTCSGTGIYAAGVVRGWSGVLAASAVDQINSAQPGGTMTSIQAGPVAPTQNQEVILFVNGNTNEDGGDTYSVDLGFTDLTRSAFLAATYYGIADAYIIQTTATSANPTMSWGNASLATAAIVSLKAMLVVESDDSGFEGSGTTASSATGNHEAGHALIVICSNFDSAEVVTSVMNSAGDTFVSDSTAKRYNTYGIEVWWDLYSAGNASDVVTCTWAGSVLIPAVVVIEVAPVGTLSFDVASSSTAEMSGMSYPVQEFDTAAGGIIIYAGRYDDPVSDPPTGYTALELANAYKVTTGPETNITPAATYSMNQDFVAVAVSFTEDVSLGSGGGRSLSLHLKL